MQLNLYVETNSATDMQQQKIIILDFGSQTTQLIARRLRELDTFCEILPYNKFPLNDPDVIGVILSGSPYSVYAPEAFSVDLNQFRGRIPVLGICYGAQYMSHSLGGKVEPNCRPLIWVIPCSRVSQRTVKYG